MTRHLLALLALYVLLAASYSLLVPPWEAPDETAHYLVVEHLARRGEMPPFEQSYETVQPPGYYWLGAGVFQLIENIDSRLTTRQRPPLTPQSEYTRYGWTAQNYRFLWTMQILRWFNAALGALALIFIFQGARILFAAADAGLSPGDLLPGTLPPLAVVALVGLTPQFLHNVTAVSNDALANAAGAFLFWLLVRNALRPPCPLHLALAALAATMLPFLIKLTILPLSAALLLVLAWRAWRGQRRLLVATVVVSLFVLAAGLALAAPASAQFLLSTLWWRLTYIRPDIYEGWSLAQILSYYAAGYWGQIGWKFAALPRWLWAALWAAVWMGAVFSLRLLFAGWQRRRFWRWIFFAATLLTALGMLVQGLGPWWHLPWLLPVAAWTMLVLALWRMRAHDPVRHVALPAAVWRAVWLAAGLAFLVVFRNALTTAQFQARFLFPALGPIATIIVVGWWVFLPNRAQARLTPAIVSAFLVLNLFFWLDTIIPRFYQPFLDG